jgi:CSLREA domain-containing protein/uncharacterized repeat protein (TIGR01451 family)
MNDRLPFGSPFLSTLASSRFRRLLVLTVAVATLLLLAVGSGSAHSLTAVDGNDSDWLAGFGAAGCPSLPGANSASLYSTSSGCTLPGGAKGTEYIWTDTLGDQRTDHWSGTGNLDLTQFRMTATETHLNFLLRFSDITNCNAQYIAIAVNSGAGGTTFFPDNAETNLPFGYERVVEVNTNATGYWTDNTTFTSAGSSFCNDTANLWEIQMPLSGLGLSYPFASGQYDFAAAIFCRDTGGTICEAGGSDAMDAITTVGGNTFNEVGDGTLNYSFTTALNDPVDVQITKSGPSSANLGAQVEYTLTFVNNGPGTATGVVITDDLPSQLTNVSYTVFSQSDPATTVTVRPSTEYIWDVSNLGTGDTVTIKVTGTLDPNAALTSFDNTATIATTADDTSAGNSSTTTLTPTDPVQPGPTFTVNSTADTNDGQCTLRNCTLREAINAANARTNTNNDATSGADPDAIHFDIPDDFVQTITPNSSGLGRLPSITDTVVIDGATQPGASCAPWPATLLIELSGSSLPSEGGTLLTLTASNSTVRGLVLNSTATIDLDGAALRVEGSSNRVECNFIGTDAAGNSTLPNDMGLYVTGVNNIIGTDGNGTADEAERNLISGNNYGVLISGAGSSSNRVAGNYIGTNAAGTSALANDIGVFLVTNTSSNIIGTNNSDTDDAAQTGDEAEANLISGNLSYGVWILFSDSNRVAGNRIGTTAAGTSALANGAGVFIQQGATNRVGGVPSAEQNTIAYNTNDGIAIQEGTGNRVQGNTVHDNGGEGIDLGNNGPTANDTADPDTGPNNLQNYPTFTALINLTGQLVVSYAVDSSTSNSTYPLTIEFFKADSQSSGEGETFLGNDSYNQTPAMQKTVTLGSATGLGVVDGDPIVATATDADGNTSEFSLSVSVVADVVQSGPTFTVNTTDDTNDGVCSTFHCSLREAINAANTRTNTENDATSGVDPDNIHFNIAGSGVQTITPASSLPSVTDAVVIDGTTQTGASCAAWPPTLLVQLSGSNLDFGSDLLILAASNSTVRGLVLNGTANGRALGVTGSSNRVECNFIGTDAAGTSAVTNETGVLIGSGANNNVVGTNGDNSADTAERNLISGNGTGVVVAGTATNNRVAGNTIGTNADGTSALANGIGVYIHSSASNNIIGGALSVEQNVIAYNTGDGVIVSGSTSTGNRIQRNAIHDNGQQGIDLGDNGPTANDAGDPDTGANNLQNYPTLTALINASGQLVVTYAVDSVEPNSTYPLRVEFFEADSAASGEGETFLGRDTYNETPATTKSVTLGSAITLGVAGGNPLVATATDDNSINGNTSEFSVPVLVDIEQAGPTFTTNSADDTDDGYCTEQHCSLREAINAANTRTNTDNDATSGADPDAIEFDLAGSGVRTITPDSSLPIVTDPVVIDGTTQSDASCASWPPTLRVQVSGSSLASGSNLLNITGSNSTVRGLVLNGTANGAALGVMGSGNRIECNFIGTNATGNLSLPSGTGVLIESGATNNLISTNLISGNTSYGVRITGTGTSSNRVAGNTIGTNAAGTSGVANAVGVSVENGASNNIIGTNGDGTADGAEGNLISGNSDVGIMIAGSDTANNRIAGNYIGTNAAGTSALPNVTGVSIAGDASSNIIGTNGSDTDPAQTGDEAEGNLISGNDTNGVQLANDSHDNIIAGNLIGVVPSTATPGDLDPLGNGDAGIIILDEGTESTNNLIGGNLEVEQNVIAYNGGDGVAIVDGTGNRVQRNSMFDNSEEGIDLGDNGHTPNDFGDLDGSPNHFQNYPTMGTAIINSSGELVVTYFVDSFDSDSPPFSPASTYPLTIEFFEADSATSGEGRTFLAEDTYTMTLALKTHNLGSAAALRVAAGDPLVGTATDAEGNTSEFSVPVTVAAPAAAQLAGFSATQEGEQVLLQWETVSEQGNAGFHLYRSTSPDSEGERLNAALIASEAPNSSQGFAYQWVDNDVEVGTTYYYWLEAVDLNGTTSRYGPASVEVNTPTALTLDTFAAGRGAGRGTSALAALGLAGLLALLHARWARAT